MIDSTVIRDNWGYSVPQTQAGPGSAGQQKTSPNKPTGTTTTTGGSVANTPAATFNYPSEWGQAGDVWSQMANGTYSNQGMDYLKNFLQGGGSSGQLSNWANAYKGTMMDDYSNMVKQMAEQAGVGGTRYGSGLQSQIGNYGSQLQNRFASDYMSQLLGAQGTDVGTATNLAGLGLGAKQSGLEGLLSLGGQKAQLPLNVAQTMMGLGQGMSGDQMNWYNLMNSVINGTNNQQQQYTPNTLQSILSSLSGTLGNDLYSYQLRS